MLINNYRRIIQRMGYLWDIYKVTSWVDEEVRKHNIKDPNVARSGQTYMLRKDGVIENLLETSSKSPEKVRDIVDSAIVDEFLSKQGNGTESYVWVNPGRGRRLLRRAVWNKIPTGLLKEVLNDNSFILSFLSGLLGGLVPLIIYILSKGNS